ncbi:MAG: DNA-binding protein WhiA [Clostridia bacterium]|nr:DNA-binding protein WhiA [Clostridia bacterium]
MSFSSTVKEELVRLPLGKSCCMLHEIGALTQTSGSLSLRGGGKVRVTYRVENAALARRIFLLIRTRLGITPALHFVQHARLGGRRSCILTLDDEDAQKLLLALHMMEEENGVLSLKRTVPRHAMTRQCCRRAFIRGAFLGAGSMTSPEKGYHFEIIAAEPGLKKTLLKLFEKAELPGRSVPRKGVEIVYLKDSQHIADMLTLMGAHQGLMAFENARVRKNVRNRVNRVMNCDQSNMEKQLDASQRQVEAIKALAIARGLDSLPPSLKEIAYLRLEKPEANLKQLGDLLDPPIGKSGVNHRLRRLMALAQELEESQGKEDEE